MVNDAIIRPTHLNRLAYVYYRQSSERQVLQNTGSRDYQLAQVDMLIRAGWKRENIRIADKDGARTGTTTANRFSYQQMMKDLQAALVGSISVTALDRAGRDDLELQRLLKECALFDTLLIIDDTPIDLNKPGALFTQQIMALVAAENNVNRRDTMRRGLLGKLAMGLVMSRPPSGYVIPAKGKWGKDPDPLVQASIDACLRTPLRLRSFAKATQALREQGVQFPRRDRDGHLHWSPVTEAALLRMAKNRNYTGDYVYGRLRVDPRRGRTEGGKLRMRQATEEELYVRPNNHPGYMTHEEFAELQHIIEINRPSQDRRNMGCGTALLEGKLVRCATHRNHAMRVSYQVDDTNRPRWCYYGCIGDRLAGGDGCGSVAGATLEPVVVRAILERLSTPRLEAIRRAWEEARAAEGDEQYQLEAKRAHARKEVDAARKRCLSVDREKYPETAEEYDAVLNQAKINLKKIESLAALPPSPLSLFTDQSWKELLLLSADLQAIWDAEATTTHDKKELIRTLVQAVVIDTMTPEQVRRGRIVWQDGTPDTPFELATRESVRTRILQLKADGLRNDQIAERLNQGCLQTLQGNPWSGETVRKRIKEHERRCARATDRAA